MHASVLNVFSGDAQPGAPARLLLLASLLTIGACVAPPPHRAYRVRQVESVPSKPVPSEPVASVYVYPANGQSAEQLDRDRYECHQWSVQQTGYDPSRLHANSERVEVVSAAPQGSGTVAGAVTGAVLGAIIGGPRHAGGGALVGAVAGTVVGATADANRQEQTERVQAHYDQRHEVVMQQAASYRRAISACLEGRGYTVK